MFTERDIAHVRELRAADPAAVRKALVDRVKRPFLRAGGRLLIIAADHPARGALGAGSSSTAMADRIDLLRRLAVALERPGVDGVLATSEILEDLAVLGLLDDRLAIGSVNRGGLHQSAFELDDRVTGYDVAGARAARLDALKCLLRIDLADKATVRTLERIATVVSRTADQQMPVFVEPFLVERRDGRIQTDLSTDGVIRSMVIAQALGPTSAWKWLKIPVVAGMERVVAATTLPIVLLGGESSPDPEPLYERWRKALALPGVHGMMVGRSVLYPHDDDVAGAVDQVSVLVNG